MQTTITTPTPPKHHTGTKVFGLLCLGLLAMFVLSQRFAALDAAGTGQPTSDAVQKNKPEDVARWCTGLGDWAMTAVRGRDMGISRAQEESVMRKPSDTATTHSGISLILTEVYEMHRYDTPSQVAKATESDCLGLMYRYGK